MADQIADEPEESVSGRDYMAFISMILVPLGAGIAWGFGGLIFGVGLWLLVGAASSYIEAAIEKAGR